MFSRPKCLQGHMAGLPNADMKINLPCLSLLKSVAEKFKNLDHTLNLKANLNGELELSIRTDSFKVKSSFKGLEVSSII